MAWVIRRGGFAVSGLIAAVPAEILEKNTLAAENSVLSGMIRFVLYRFENFEPGVWREGVVHSFIACDNIGCAVVEDRINGELNMVPVSGMNIRYAINVEQWADVQRQAQQAQNSQLRR
jgi:hypothetical protein